MKHLLTLIIILYATSSLATNNLECQTKYNASITKKGEKKVMHQSGADKGSIHLFSGIGSDVLKLKFKHKPNDKPDILIKIFDNNYIQVNKQVTVLWRFYPKKNIAVKFLTYINGASTVTSTGWYSCK